MLRFLFVLISFALTPGALSACSWPRKPQLVKVAFRRKPLATQSWGHCSSLPVGSFGDSIPSAVFGDRGEEISTTKTNHHIPWLFCAVQPTLLISSLVAEDLQPINVLLS